MADCAPDTTTWTAPAPLHATVEVMQSRRGLLSHLLSEPAASATATSRRLCLLIPGNPGIVDLYREFCVEMHVLGFDVLVMGFAGHSFVEHNEGRLFGLQEQIAVADAFVDALTRSPVVQQCYTGQQDTDGDAGVFLAAHSIGAYVALHLLDRHASIRRCFGLCPVVTRVRDAPRAQRLLFWTSGRGQWLASSVSRTFPLWPRWARDALANELCGGGDAALHAMCAQHLRHSLLMNVLGMAADEFRDVAQPDTELLTRVQTRLCLYYVPRDHWAPPAHANEVRELCPHLAGYAMEQDESVAHAWCLAHTSIAVKHGVVPFL